MAHRPKPISTQIQGVEAGPKTARNEHESEAHKVRVSPLRIFTHTRFQIYRSAPGHRAHGRVPDLVNPTEETVPGIVHPGSTGVIYCSDRYVIHPCCIRDI
jgi:hypothetical protein